MEASMEINLLPWKLLRKSVEVDLLPRKFLGTLVEVDLLPWKLDASVEVSTAGGSGSFRCFHQLQLPRIYSVEASMRIHIPLLTYIYLHEYHKFPAAFTTLTPRWSYLHGSSFLEAHASTLK